MNGIVSKSYRQLKRRVPFEFDGFSVIIIFGFIPFPAPHFKRKRARAKLRRHSVARKPITRLPIDPVSDTIEHLRQDAIDEGDYGVAFGAAIIQNMYEKNKKGDQSTA